MILVSGCLSGNNRSYNGKYKKNSRIEKMVKDGAAIPVCPEILGGLTMPRERCEIRGGSGIDVINEHSKVISESGRNVTENFIKGARSVLELAKEHNIKKAIFKSLSPSCSSNLIYDGTFSGKTIKGVGVTTALLKKNGIEVTDEHHLT